MTALHVYHLRCDGFLEGSAPRQRCPSSFESNDPTVAEARAKADDAGWTVVRSRSPGGFYSVADYCRACTTARAARPPSEAGP